MSTPDSKHTQTFAALGITSADQVHALFAELRARFDADASNATDESSWKSLRDSWFGRKSGVLTLITDNWLKPSSPNSNALSALP